MTKTKFIASLMKAFFSFSISKANGRLLYWWKEDD